MWDKVSCSSFLRRGLTQRYSTAVKTLAGRNVIYTALKIFLDKALTVQIK